MKKKTYNYSRLFNSEIAYPNIHNVDYDGSVLDLKTHLEHLFPVSVQWVKYKGNDIVIKYKHIIDNIVATNIENEITRIVQKTSLTDIEVLQTEWFYDDKAVLNLLPTIEDDLTTLYNATLWENLNPVEKRILSYWHVPTNVQKLEVFTQEQLDNFAYYKLYRLLSDFERNKLTKDDIKFTPKSIDFKTQTEGNYIKKTSPLERGRPTKKEYFLNYDLGSDEYSYKFAEVNFTFIDIPGSDLILEKVAMLSWVKNDESVDLVNTKNIGEKYNPNLDGSKQIQEGEKRRKNIYDTIKANVVAFVAMTETSGNVEEAVTLSTNLLKEVAADFEKWIQVGSDLQSETGNIIFNRNESWLDNQVPVLGNQTIRYYILSEIAISKKIRIFWDIFISKNVLILTKEQITLTFINNELSTNEAETLQDLFVSEFDDGDIIILPNGNEIIYNSSSEEFENNV